MSRLRSTLALTALLALSASVGAQANRRHSTLPRGLTAPDGMCRVWIDGVSADRQPAATDCASARANAGANARVIYGRGLNTNVNSGMRVNGPWGVGTNTNDPRRSREMDKAERKREHEIEKANRKRDKQWNKGRKHGDDGDDGDDDDDDQGENEHGQRGHHGQHGQRGQHDDDGDDDRGDRDDHGRGGVNGCVDSNRDGRCDVRTNTGVLFPRILRP